MADGNIHGLTNGSIITISRRGISTDTRFVVKVAGDDTHRIYEEGSDAKTDNFKIFDHEVLALVEQGERKVGEEKPARDRTGEAVKRVVYHPTRGYLALLQLGASENCRVATIVDGKVAGSGEKLPKADFSPPFALEFQIPTAKRQILSNPEGAPAPDDLGLSAEEA